MSELEKKKPGPAPTRGRAATFRLSSQTRRKALLDAGKVELKVYIEPETKVRIQAIKEKYLLDTLGEALDRALLEPGNLVE